jgi:2-dehydro-3-deoxygluconokinase
MVVCLGELLLRLKAPGKNRLLQVPTFEASFGGSETNTAALLATLGKPVALVTSLPQNELGEAALRFLRQLNIQTELVRLDPGRMGLYFLEEGALGRPSKVLYDREQSAFSLINPEWVPDWGSQVEWLHLSGITPALSQRSRDWSLNLVRRANQAGIKVSLDLNHRTKLWKWGEPSHFVLPQYLPYVHVLLANESDLQTSLGAPFKTIEFQHPTETLLENAQHLFKTFPNIEALAVSIRHARSADDNQWSGALVHSKEGVFFGPTYQLCPIVDRVGAGDAFGAGIIASFIENRPLQEIINRATALGALKHSISGDVCLTTQQEVDNFLKDQSGRINR